MQHTPLFLINESGRAKWSIGDLARNHRDLKFRDKKMQCCGEEGTGVY